MDDLILLILSSPSGAGKTTLTKYLLDELPDYRNGPYADLRKSLLAEIEDTRTRSSAVHRDSIAVRREGAAQIALVGPPLFSVLGLKGGLAAGASRPMVILALSMPAFAVSSAASSWLEGLGRMTPPMLLMWIANILNLGIDLVLVPGGFGIHAMGASGAAIATSAGRVFLKASRTGLRLSRSLRAAATSPLKARSVYSRIRLSMAVWNRYGGLEQR